MAVYTGKFDVGPLSDEQLRIAVNLEAAWIAQRDARRALRALGPNLAWRQRGGTDYLYTVDGQGNGTSLGRRSTETEARIAHFRDERARWMELERGAAEAVALQASLYRAARMLQVSSKAAAILRMLDELAMLDGSLLVVGTNTMAAYELEAGARFVGADDAATRDFDLAVAGAPVHLALSGGLEVESTVFGALKRADPTYTVNTERSFQARNKDAYEVELLVAPSQLANVPRDERLRPAQALPEQEWLLKGRRVDRVVGALDGSVARIVAPDPRWMALHKIWLARKPSRTPLKKAKDERQGHALLAVTLARMPHYPLDEAFRAELPRELSPLFETSMKAATRMVDEAREVREPRVRPRRRR